MFRFLYKTFSRPLPAAGILLLLTSCQMMWSPPSPRSYMLRRPEKMILTKKLNEISGLYFLRKEGYMIAVADDKKKIYRLGTDGKEGDFYDPELPSADFEDVVMVDSTVYTLISDGTIIAINKTDTGLTTKSYPFGSTEEKNDFETLYYDSSAKGLVILCKSCASEKGKQVRTAFRFDLATLAFDKKPHYTISSKAVQNVLKDGKVDFKPSALAIHPIENRMYILSSAGNLLVVASREGMVEEAYRLNPTLYPQAEGIAFATNGDMYISNEAKLGKPTLLRILYKPTRKNNRP